MSRQTFERAVRNVAKWGDTDVFPYPIENHVLHDQPEGAAQLLESVAADFHGALGRMSIHSHSALTPVGYTGFRWATQVDPLWNAYLLGLVTELGSRIEEQRIPVSESKIYSYRFIGDAASDALFTMDSWSQFQERSRSLAGSTSYVVAVDIADFYSRVYHHRLENSLAGIDDCRTITAHIMEILKRLSNNTSYGLPVGGPAARLLAELLLNRVDRLIDADPHVSTFCRFADDYRFFVPSMQAAYKAIGLLSEKLFRNEGMSLQKAKTRIMPADEYLSMLEPASPETGSAAAFLRLHIHYDPYSPTAIDDYEELKRHLAEFDILDLLKAELGKGRVHPALTRRLVTALQFLEPELRSQAIRSLIENFETLGPVLPQVLPAITASLVDLDDDLVDRVHSFIRDKISEGHYLAQVDVNLAFMIRLLGTRRNLQSEQLLIRLYGQAHGFGQAPSPSIQRDIMLILAKWRITYWLSDQKNYMLNAHPWVRRAFIVSSYTLGDEGRHWRDANKAGFSEFDLLIRDWVSAKVRSPGWEIPA